jgi:hypothetical protein
MTAYAMSRLEANAATVLGLFIQMIAQHVKGFGKLRLGDILQYLTIAEVDRITADAPLVYKTFLMHDKQSDGATKTRKIQFDGDMSDEPMSGKAQLKASYDVLQQGSQTDMEIWKANPRLMRELKYILTVSPDTLSPKSSDLEKQYDLETYDRAINNPSADQEQIFRLLLATNDKTRRNPDKYVMKSQAAPAGIMQGLNPQQQSPFMGQGQQQQQPTGQPGQQQPMGNMPQPPQPQNRFPQFSPKIPT